MSETDLDKTNWIIEIYVSLNSCHIATIATIIIIVYYN